MSIDKIRELTERLAAAESMFESLFEQAPDAYVVTDHAGTIIMANQQAEILFGYPRDEMVGQKIEMLVPERFREKHTAQREQACELEATISMGEGSCLASHKDGSEVPVQIQHGPLRTNGTTYSALAIREATVAAAAAL